jgi:hypothetical protein
VEYAFRKAANSGEVDTLVNKMASEGWEVQQIIKEQTRYWVMFQRSGIKDDVVEQIFDEMNILAERIHRLEEELTPLPKRKEAKPAPKKSE